MVYKITQLKGDNFDYYKKFWPEIPEDDENSGHEGSDIIIPSGVVLAMYPGIVVTDVDEAEKGRGYGIYVTIWHPHLNIATQYCHLKSNRVSEGQKVVAGQPIGIEGATQTKGRHTHINVIVVDDTGRRIRSIGNQGRIDPLVHILRSYGDPMWCDHLPWADWLKENPKWVLGDYIYGPSTL